MNTRFFTLFVVVALIVGLVPAQGQSRAITPRGMDLTSSFGFYNTETHSGPVPELDPHLFLTVVMNGKDGEERTVESAPTIAVHRKSAKVVQVSLLTTGLVSRPEEYPFESERGKTVHRKVYAVIHEQPIGQREVGRVASFENPIPGDSLDNAESGRTMRAAAMEPIGYKRLSGKKVQYSEATPSELAFEITPPDRPGTYAYVIMMAGEWRTDGAVGTPLPKLALRWADKSTKYVPYAFRIDWVDGELTERRLVDTQTKKEKPKVTVDKQNDPITLNYTCEIQNKTTGECLTAQTKVLFRLLDHKPGANDGGNTDDTHKVLMVNGKGAMEIIVPKPGTYWIRGWSSVQNTDGSWNEWFSIDKEIVVPDDAASINIKQTFRWTTSEKKDK